MTRRFRCFSVALALLYSAVFSFSSNAESPADLPPPTSLALLLNYASGDLPRAEELAALISNSPGPVNGNDSMRSQILERLGNPTAARTLITKRLGQEARAALSDDDPEELLHRYVTLDFPTPEAMRAAKARLQRDPAVLFVEEGKYARFASTPSDPDYAYACCSVVDWQWGIDDPLSLQAAWSTVRGTAFLGHLDNGIQVVHEDLGQPYRRFTFWVGGGTDVDEHPEQVVRPGYPAGYAGHGTHTAGIMAAATSQATVPAGYPNPSALGGAGVCWYCNLIIARVSRVKTGGDGYPAITVDSTNDVPNAINWA